ncbi:hypothetical protein [Streptomyces akebiae]|uniref:Tetratricopeptide repeat protein n=1 Tax=Streptomyces akebiae TaxID=2865673 RepID=A0ABX8XHX3_9ACTN|nr:hypothetical protein [Streptomyces akebiae]QYX75135.1 hypothetical protein K1J60_00155 [Streptomyces akebiae]
MAYGELDDSDGVVGQAAAAVAEVADHGSTEALYRLAVMRQEAGDREGAETLARMP